MKCVLILVVVLPVVLATLYESSDDADKKLLSRQVRSPGRGGGFGGGGRGGFGGGRGGFGGGRGGFGGRGFGGRGFGGRGYGFGIGGGGFAVPYFFQRRRWGGYYF